MSAETRTSTDAGSADVLKDIAETFVRARLEADSFDAYPGPAPADLDTAYRIQDTAIDLWPDALQGWKVGRIPPAVEDDYGCDRLAGPIFAGTIRRQHNGEVPDMTVFGGGFAAVEAEYVAVVGDDAPADKLAWSREEAEAMVAELHIGLEVASSPFAGINDLGPAVTASDFGNNAGLIVGPAIADWRERDPQTMTCASYVDGQLKGEGGAFRLTGGITRSVQFMLELAARRGRPLKRGDVIATGQTSGIHEVAPGQSASIRFGDDGELNCRLVAATPG